jgi:PAS domain S-box-containing protein
MTMPQRDAQAKSEDDERNRQIIECAIDYAVIGSDLRGNVNSWNEGARLILGWTAAEMLGQPVSRFFTPEDVAAGVPESELAGASEHGRALDDRWHLRKSGERFWASGELMPLRDGEGRPTGYVKILRDRTSQRRTEDDLRELNASVTASEARLQMALEVGGMGVWQADLRTRETRWWPGMDLVHGLPAGSVPLSMDAYDSMVHPDDREHVRSVVQQAVARREGHRIEYRVVWPDGSVHWLEGRSRLVLGDDGEPQTMSGVCLDITRRKHVEHDLTFLARAGAELSALTDHQSTLDTIARLAVPHFADWCAVDWLEEDGTLRRMAVAHVDPAKVALAMDLHRRYPPSPEHPDAAWSVLSTGTAQLVHELTDEMMASTIADPDHLSALRALGLRSYIGVPLTVRGRTLGALLFIAAESGRRYEAADLALAEDLARRASIAIENARLVQALRDSDRAKDVFLATLAHELRNPLAPIRNGLTLIQLSPTDGSRIAQMTGVIERQVKHLMRLVDDLLDISRITTGKIELKKEQTNLVSIVNSAIETARPHIEAAQHRLTVSFPSEPTTLRADPVRLAQVFSNLLNNASKYTPHGGEIHVQVESAPTSLAVRVTDTGTGIEPGMLKRVFKLFTQVTHPAERRQGGLGIGLSLVDGLVRLHGGSVEARSLGLGKGSEFVVNLPREPGAVDAASAPAAAPEAALPAGATPRRILVVDDNVDAATTVADLLAIFGNDVAVVHDGSTAIDRTVEFRPDVVLLDIGLPDVNGYEVARRIRKLEGVRQPLLVALTGWGQEADKRLAASAGFDQHWTKPVDTVKLKELSTR